MVSAAASVLPLVIVSALVPPTKISWPFPVTRVSFPAPPLRMLLDEPFQKILTNRKLNADLQFKSLYSKFNTGIFSISLKYEYLF
jgi:hypothetical protein